MIQTLNFPLSGECIRPYGTWDALGNEIRALGLDGLEVIADPFDPTPAFPAELAAGYHLTFYPDWLDFFRGDEAALLRKFGSPDMVERIYGGRRPEDLLRVFREDLKRGRAFGVPYMVFHVSDVSMEENYTYRWRHTDREVIDASIELLNELLRGVEPDFDLLVENQWWPGFTFTDPEQTEYLLSRVAYPRTGIMLDTGHLMNCNPSIRSQADGIDWILDSIRRHGSLSRSVRGLHFHQSVSGAYVRSHTGSLPAGWSGDYFREFPACYAHIQRIDRHRPWTNPECVRIIDTVEPSFLTHELAGSGGRTQLSALRRQLKTIQRGRT